MFKILTAAALLLLTLETLPACAYSIRDNAIQHAERGETFLERQRYSEAMAEFQIAIQLNPDSPFTASLYNNLGLAAQKAGRYLLAIQSFQKAIRLQPGFELFYKNLIRTYQLSGKLAKAKTTFSGVTQNNPQDAEAWYLLGLVYEAQHKQDEAKKAFIKFIDLEPYSLLAEAARKHL